MLTRHILRVKALQALFSYYLTCDALIDVELSALLDHFTFDPSKHGPEEAELFKTKKLIVEQAYRKFLDKMAVDEDDFTDTEFIILLNDSYRSLTKSRDREKKAIKNRMVKDIRDLSILYYKLLLLPAELSALEIEENEKRAKSLLKKPAEENLYFSSSTVVTQLSTLTELRELADPVSWKQEKNILKDWYKKIISKYDFVQKSTDGEDSIEKDLASLQKFYKLVLFKNPTIDAYFTEIDLHWDENKFIVKDLILKTLKSYDTTQLSPSFSLKSLIINEAEDMVFFETLYEDTVARNTQLEEIIKVKAKNWELDRMALTDLIIIKMALTEMISFPSIPIKVTINEFIDISKDYSTPKSKQFVNGILDVLANQLTSEGIIRKSGRGLLDNK